MEDKLFKRLDELNIMDTKLLLDKDINLPLDSSIRKRIEKSIHKKTGYYNTNNIFKDKVNNILGSILMKKKIALALSFGVILGLTGGGYAYAKTPVAYVSMDINPSVELGVNAFDQVISVEAYNEDGENILEGTDLVNTDIDDAVTTVILNAISEGYINNDGSSAIEITTSTDKEDVATELDESLKEIVNEALEDNNVEAEVETEKVALARRNEARKLGITPGKLNLIQKLQELDSTINVEDYKDSSVKDIQKKTKELRKNNNIIIIDDSTITVTGTEEKIDVVSEENNEETTLSKTSFDSDETKVLQPEKNDSSSNIKDNNGNTKKEENSNDNEEKKITATITEKQNNSNNGNSQGNSNSSKLKDSSDSDSKSKNNNNNTTKSDNSQNGNSGTQNKDKSNNN